MSIAVHSQGKGVFFMNSSVIFQNFFKSIGKCFFALVLNCCAAFPSLYAAEAPSILNNGDSSALEQTIQADVLEEVLPSNPAAVNQTLNFPEQSTDPSSPLSQPTQDFSTQTALLTTTIAGRSFYVSTTGSNTSDGSSATPWQSIQYGVSQLQAGDTLYIQGGIYGESVGFLTSGLADAYITIEGVGNVIIDGSKMPSYGAAFNTNSHDYLRFTNLTVNNAKAGVDITNGSDYIDITGLKADHDQFAVRMDTASNVNVRNSTATNSYYGYRAYGYSHDLLFEDIQTSGAHDPAATPDYKNGDGFILESNVSNVTMRRISSWDNDDAGFDIKASNVLVENCITYGNKNNLKVWGSNITIRSSLSYNAKRQLRPGGTTVEGNGITVESGATVKLENMTFADNEDHDVRIYAGGNLSILNSIVARRASNGILFKNEGVFNHDYVLWYDQDLSGPNFSLAAHDLWADPKFVNWSQNNFRLSSSSPAIEYSGTSTSLSSYDLDQKPRVFGMRVDLGAYEYQQIIRRKKR